MGIDLYLNVDREEHRKDIWACVRNLACEEDVRDAVTEAGCRFFTYVVDDDSGPIFHDATEVLSEFEKAVKLCEELDDGLFEYGKNAALQDMEELEKPLRSAAELGCRVSLEIS